MGDMNKKVLVIGGGGREHALGWKLAQSERVAEVLYAKGNAGTAVENKARNIDVEGIENQEHFPALYDLIEAENIDMVIVGPEAPLANGLVNFLAEKGYTSVIGPKQQQAKLEYDKFYSYDVMDDLGIKQAPAVQCYTVEDAMREIKIRERNIVIKARGLKAGKGVSVHKDWMQASYGLKQKPELYGTEMLIAQQLFGEEFSAFGLCDGKTAHMLKIATQDHKQLHEGDLGPNTGGMGAYCPAPIAKPKDLAETQNIMDKIVDETGFKGFLYAGMMKTSDGLYVIEFNVRMGDPETQPLMMQMKGDLYTALESVMEGRADEIELGFKPGSAGCIVLASPGYPGDYSAQKGKVITGIDDANKVQYVKVFHAGTATNDAGETVVAGGRVLGVTAHTEAGISATIRVAYSATRSIYCGDGSFHQREDIAQKKIDQQRRR